MKFVLAALLLASTALALPVQQVDDTRSLSERHQTELAHVKEKADLEVRLAQAEAKNEAATLRGAPSTAICRF